MASRSVGFIGFNDAYGDSWLTEATRALEAKGIRLVDTERYARTDTSVIGQTLKLMAAKPDAVLIAGSGTPAALPEKTLKERGYTGQIYQTHGVANADFLRVGGKDVEGTILPAGPVLVAGQLPDSNPIKPGRARTTSTLRGRNTAQAAWRRSAPISTTRGCCCSRDPEALKKGSRERPQFRAALRDALEGLQRSC